MDDLEKLSCKEELLDLSDMEHSANDDHKDNEGKMKKRKRRRREVDMIKLSDDDETDDEHTTGKKMVRRFSPGPNSPASHREPRTCVLKASQKRRPLSRLLEQLLRNLEKRDPHQFFAWPVNDNFAPNYSNIIKRPMDFSTMKQKIDDNEYRSLNCFINDFKLMCNNAMKYNKAGTVYHKAARRLLHAGLKQLTPHKLRPLGDHLTFMYEIPIRELGFDIGKMDLHKLKRTGEHKSGGSEAEGADSLEHADAGDSVKLRMEEEREQHRRRLAKKAFPRMDASGRTTLGIVTSAADGDERPLTLGQYIGKLTHGTGTLHTTREDRRNLAKCVKPLLYGPFSSYAPAYDGTFATLTQDESHLVLHTLPSELGQTSPELLRFAADSPWACLYDMEAMFPDRRPPEPAPADAAPEPAPADTVPIIEEPDLAGVRVDVGELRALAALGVDVDFLADIEDDVRAATRDYGLRAALAHTADVLARLEREQRERLSAPPPPHLSLCARAGAAEREAARASAACLRAMVARVPPAAVAPLGPLRRALGVTLDHLDTPLSVDELEDGTERDTSDPDSRSSQ